MYRIPSLATAFLEFNESPGVVKAAALADAAAELGEIEEVAADAAFITENPSDEADDGERADDSVGEAGDRIGVVHVRPRRRHHPTGARVTVP